MSRLKRGAVPGIRLHKPTGKAVVTLSGQDFYLGPFGSKTAVNQYDQRVSEWLARGRRPLLEVETAGEMTIVELLAAYRKHAEQYYRKNGKQTQEVSAFLSVARVVEAQYGEDLVSEFGPLKLQALQQRMIGLDWSRKSINRQCQRLLRAFSWGVAQELIPAVVVNDLREVAGLRAGRTEARESAPIMPIDEASVKKTLEQLPRVPADMVRLQRLTGCRPEEVCKIKPGNIDRTGKVWSYTPDGHKMEHHSRARVIFIGPRAQRLLARYLFRDPDAHCFSPAESEQARREAATAKRKTPIGYGNRVGTNRPGREHPIKSYYTVDAYRRAIARACEKAGIPAWAPNRLRHSAATEIRKRFGLEGSQVVLGHSAADVTQIYAERDQAKAAKIMAQVG